ncbi:MAG: 1-(5-phosphoribosyl)-5-[(5-phosphoribosylamino)methylideneamino]imidazole-4-carboxamide isomerase [Desulfobacterales bacterium]|nr:1-(5-phosphoribosyl)-5-[(5-phosphoribosylamino)methylideneamino]imidazole-4-carboxamide isomerase [Desulfobacterales bacterium]
MIIIPAIDIKGGKCVRLLQGRMDAETVFSDDPAAMGIRWENDLDGAVEKKPKNLDVIADIVRQVKIPIQVGGGIRDIETIRMYLDQGVGRIVIGTEAVRNPQLVKIACLEFPRRIVVGIDARNGYVAIEGWTRTTRTTAIELAKMFEDCGVAAINFTDIERDGMRTGPNIKETEKVAMSVSVPIVASGGVSTFEDIQRLLPLEIHGVTGVITGRALYDGSLDLKSAIQFLKKQ